MRGIKLNDVRCAYERQGRLAEFECVVPMVKPGATLVRVVVAGTPSLRAVEFVLEGLVTRAEVNFRQWRARHQRSQTARAMACGFMLVDLKGLLVPLPAKITLTRIAPRKLDPGDNLSSALKAVRDGIADAYGVDDSDPRYQWVCDQEKAQGYAVNVRIEAVRG